MSARVSTGLGRLLAGDCGLRLSGRRIALIGNPTSVDSTLRHAAETLAELGTLVALFGPEHGIRGDAQYMEPVDLDANAEGIVVHSLYGVSEETLSPTDESLAGVDLVVFDIQDVGSRYYTYVWTMVLAMRVCARLGIDFVVLDRPNPIGGVHVEGGWIEDGFQSFVGLRSLPNRHGMTAGEIARWAHHQEGLDLQLDVIEMSGWKREMHFSDTGLPWVMPSPNMPTPETALVYPGMCLLEGTGISEGRGTTRPFELSGAPYVESEGLAEFLRKDELPGVGFRGCAFTPTFDKYTGTLCAGIQQHVFDRECYLPYRSAVAIVRAVRTLWPNDFSWRTHAYEFVSDIPAFDLLAGSAALRERIDAGASLAQLAETWKAGEEEFRLARQEWLLY